MCSTPMTLRIVAHSCLVRVLQATLRRGADGSTRCGTPATPRSTSRSSRRCRSISRPPGSRSSSTSTSSSPSSRPEPGSSSRTSTTSASSVSHVILIINDERVFSKSCDSHYQRRARLLKVTWFLLSTTNASSVSHVVLKSCGIPIWISIHACTFSVAAW